MKRLRDLLVGVDALTGQARLRPAGVILVAVFLAILLSGLLFGGMQIARSLGPRPLELAAPGPTMEPTPTPVPGVPWKVRVGFNGREAVGYVDDPAVQQAVMAAFLEGWTWLAASDVPQNPADLERFFAPVPEGASISDLRPPRDGYWIGIGEARRILATLSDRGLFYRLRLSGGQWEIRLLHFSPDGKGAVLEASYSGQCRYEMRRISDGALVVEGESPCARYRAGMVYDPGDGRWKIAVLLQFLPE